eukprot:TRINITY_DN4982_c1_g1_i2.p2 TRINITY_DN4982_c1_g1~~TRINITY_DN4982_c1_g1_i2.p2  ORF type:complete len:168 (-),score=1.47 TRINITY_DN4982_c1_g1_i2:4-507(-)
MSNQNTLLSHFPQTKQTTIYQALAFLIPQFYRNHVFLFPLRQSALYIKTTRTNLIRLATIFIAYRLSQSEVNKFKQYQAPTAAKQNDNSTLGLSAYSDSYNQLSQKTSTRCKKLPFSEIPTKMKEGYQLKFKMLDKHLESILVEILIRFEIPYGNFLSGKSLIVQKG